MREQNQTFNEAVNDAIRSGAAAQPDRRPFTTETASMGTSRVNLDRALQISAELEDDELIRKLRN